MKKRTLYLGSLVEVGRALYRTDDRLRREFEALAKTLEELRTAAHFYLQAKDFLRVVDPKVDVWLFSEGRAYFSLFGQKAEDVIEKYLGPLHRRFNLVWTMSYDPKGTGELTFHGYNTDAYVQGERRPCFVVISYGTTGCTFRIAKEQPKHQTPSPVYEMVCDGEGEETEEAA